ncbi:hypothetical protein BAU15_07695 [Enterococcus sp. JM4C]|uniref:hypothetical protein n=1 Tax=Candidatus Enterococcus huntleyi TaxID=1857217 RepID=UPI00137AE781|nr:hypothetical protein [Enterococcus sp. JM4C]KAF1297586.1 hypothetical protein BAU15_07695 [Enterococcus sp. JM4C]
MDWIYFLEKRTQQDLNLLLYMKENKFTVHELARHFSWHERTINVRLSIIEHSYPQVRLFRENKLVFWQYQTATTIYQLVADFFSNSPLFEILAKAAWGLPLQPAYTHHQYKRINQRLAHLGFSIQANESALLGNEWAIRKFLFDFARDFPDLCPLEIQPDFTRKAEELTASSEQLMSKIIDFRQSPSQLKLPEFCWKFAKTDQNFHYFRQAYLRLSEAESLYLYLFLHAETTSDFQMHVFPYKLIDIYLIFPDIKPWFLFIQHVFPELSERSKQAMLTKLLKQRIISQALHAEQSLTTTEKEKAYQKLIDHPKMFERLQKITERQPASIVSNNRGEHAQIIANYQLIEPILSLSEVDRPLYICLFLKLPKKNLKRLQKAIQHNISSFHAVQVTIHFGNEIPSYADICITDYYQLTPPINKSVVTLFFSSLFFEELIVELTTVIMQLEEKSEKKSNKK